MNMSNKYKNTANNKNAEIKAQKQANKKPAIYDYPSTQQLAASIMMKIQKLPHSLFKKDLEYWSLARAQAMSVNMPRRWQLQELYIDAMNDLHLFGIINKRILKISNKKIKICNKAGEEVPEALEFINKSWFRKFIKYSMESIFYGYSLVEFEFEKKIVKKCWVVDRRYVVPEFEMFLTNPGNYEGFVYTKEPYDSIAIGIGDSHDYGLLMKLSIYALLKKNAIGNWSEFAEIFGMPMRYASTPTSDPRVRRDLEDMLDQMGSAAWALFPQGTEIKFAETSKTDAFNIYNQLIERMNSEMSKCVLGQTMTTDNGSSRSQAEVHEHTEDEITEDDKAFIKNVINDQLFPLLIKNGYPLQDLIFDFNDAEQIDLEKKSKIDESISRMGFKPTKEYLEKTYSIELEEPIEQAIPALPTTPTPNIDPKLNPKR
jgi:phage gp29-like protein